MHGATNGILNSNTSGTVNPISSFISNSGNTNPYNNVKAGICYILFDEQFNYVSGQFDAVYQDGAFGGHGSGGPDGGLKSHFLQDISVTKNGYLYVYCSNESNINVWFDNLEVIHSRGQILEETHFYPFGLTMAGISSKTAGVLGNKMKWNAGSEFGNKEFSDGSGLELYETFYRSLDPQIGRLWQVDPATDLQESYSPYQSMNNNPISEVDPLGDFATKFGAKWHRFWHGGGKVGQNKYGEWYVVKDRGSETKSNGEVVAKTEYYYGKGRDMYSNARKALVRDYEIAADIQMNGEKSMYQMYESSEDAGKAALSYSGLLLPNPILKNGTIIVNVPKIQQVEKVVEKVKIIFGKTTEQINHAFRHIDKIGLSRASVQAAIETHLPTVASKIVDGKPLNQVIEVAGKKIQYTAYKLSDGTINVGRIHGAN